MLYSRFNDLIAEIQVLAHHFQQAQLIALPVDLPVARNVSSHRFQHERWLINGRHRESMRRETVVEFPREQVDVWS